MRSLKSFLRMAVVLAAVACAGAAAAVPRYKVEPLVDGDRLLRADDLNGRGQVVGSYRDEPGSPGFLWSHGKFQDISIDGADFTPKRINDRGQIAGTVNGTTYLYEGGRGININPADEPWRGFHVVALNNAGHVIGHDPRPEYAYSYFYDGHTTQRLRIEELVHVGPHEVVMFDMNDYDRVVGSYFDDQRNGWNMFSYGDGVVTSITQFEGDETGYAINNLGHIAGDINRVPGSISERPVLFRDGEAVDLLGADGASPRLGSALDLNDRDWVVGRVTTQDRVFDGFLYADGQMHDLDDLLAGRDAGRWHVASAERINEAGQILAGVVMAGSEVGMPALLTPVPELERWALMLVGLGVVGALAQRKAGVAVPAKA